MLLSISTDEYLAGHAQRITLQHVTELLRHLACTDNVFQLRLCIQSLQRLAFLFRPTAVFVPGCGLVICDKCPSKFGGHYHRRIDRVLTDVLLIALYILPIGEYFAFKGIKPSRWM